MKVLVACEESQRVCQAFRVRGHEAYSCDILPTRGDHPEWHIRDKIEHVLTRTHSNPEWVSYGIIWHPCWDLLIAFPPCDHIAVSGARWFKSKQNDGRQEAAIRFFLMLANADIPRICIENPIGIMSTKYRKPDQIIQPWQFGHGETKATCLWLKNLPKLVPTNIVEGRENRIHRMPPSPTRSRDRAVTFQGIADAMAEQWGNALINGGERR